jgi:transcriptional regulator with XRE-family HTH domain
LSRLDFLYNLLIVKGGTNLLGKFDKNSFADLLQKALGSRTAYRYSQEVNVSRGHISLLLRKEAARPPTADTIKKLASKADNEITYEQLMVAAGHLDESVGMPLDEAKNVIHINTAAGKRFSDIAPPELAEEFSELGYELLSLMQDNAMSMEELKELLVMLRALKGKRKEQKK